MSVLPMWHTPTVASEPRRQAGPSTQIGHPPSLPSYATRPTSATPTGGFVVAEQTTDTSLF